MLSTAAAARSPCRRSWVIRSPPQNGQFQPVMSLKGHVGYKARTMRIRDTYVGQRGHGYRPAPAAP